MWVLIRLLLLFTIVPAIELFILLQLGSLIGPNLTFVIILVTGLLGAWLAKREGWMVLQQLRKELQQGIPPANRLMEGVLVLAGGLLLITPGVLTDITGILFILPPSRRFLAPRVIAFGMKRLGIEGSLDARPMGAPGPEPPPPRPTPFSSPFDDLP